MNMKIFTMLLLLLNKAPVFSQGAGRIVTSDISHFWKAYDSLVYIRDTVVQQQILQGVYIGPASEGLKDFIENRNVTAAKWIKAINAYPKFWQTVRAKTLAVYKDTASINGLIIRFKKLYPALKTPAVYFFIGNIKTGGTTTNDRVLMGTEIATADSSVDTEGLSLFLKNVFRQNPGISGLVSHELVHTQQIFASDDAAFQMNLLSYCLREGACDFIAELLTGKTRKAPYIVYGNANEKKLWWKFKAAMYSSDIQDWLYNGGTAAGGQADLGYFMGYTICKYYYLHVKNKSGAVRGILQINYNDTRSVKDFFDKTGYDNKFR
jgi:hypothetical protein